MELKKGDHRRLYVVLVALSGDRKLSLVELQAKTGMPRPTLNDAINKIEGGQVPEVILGKDGAKYYIADWGNVINEAALKKWAEDQEISCNAG